MQTYIDNIQDLLLNHNLLGSKQNDDVAILAQARTLIALQGLDPERKRHLLILLYEDELIGFDDISHNLHVPIIKLNNAKILSPNLNEALFYGANLSNVDLSNVNLQGADLSNTNLNNVKLQNAELTDVIFFQASLVGAHLNNADLTGAVLIGANLSNTNLTGAKNLTQAELNRVNLCTNAILPTGLTCHQNL